MSAYENRSRTHSDAHQGTPRVSDIQSHDCRAVSGILSRIGDKWSVLIISAARARGRRRFNEIKRMIGGISQRMLTLTLRNLERDGLVSRTVTPTVPPRVDYALTDLGRDLLGPVTALGAVGDPAHRLVLRPRAPNLTPAEAARNAATGTRFGRLTRHFAPL